MVICSEVEEPKLTGTDFEVKTWACDFEPKALLQNRGKNACPKLEAQDLAFQVLSITKNKPLPDVLAAKWTCLW